MYGVYGNVKYDTHRYIGFMIYDPDNLPVTAYLTNGEQLIYENDVNGNRVRNTISGSSDNYYLKDHLGSIKMTVDATRTVQGYDDYYPYGMQMTGRCMTSSEDGRYKFTGKERDASEGLDYFGARYYDSWKPGWDQVDPMADKYPGWSSYNYCLDNPGRYIDPDGADLGWYEDENGNKKYEPNVNSQENMNTRGIEGKYLGEHGWEFDEKTGEVVQYTSDGKVVRGLLGLDEVEVTAKGTPQSTEVSKKVSTVLTGIGIPLEGQKDILSYAAKGAEYLKSDEAFQYLIRGSEEIARGAGYINVGVSVYQLWQHPSWRNLTNVGIESSSLIPGMAIPIGLLDITGAKDQLLNMVLPNGK
jgi:RHS repeat-associated protein